MALMAAARGTIRTAPVQVQEYTLPLKERQLPDDEKKALAEQIVHGQEYYSYKNKIYEKLNDFETSVMERTEERLMVETESISSLLHVQNVFEIVEELVIHLSGVAAVSSGDSGAAQVYPLHSRMKRLRPAARRNCAIWRQSSTNMSSCKASVKRSCAPLRNWTRCAEWTPRCMK